MEEEVVVAVASFDYVNFLIRFLLDITSLFVLVGLLYYPKHKNKDFVFNFVLFNVINFLICSLLGAAKIKVGFAFGLFAMFSIIRYRTIAISIKDMGYFFICVALGMINSLGAADDMYLVLICSNIFIILLTFGLERLNFLINENSKEVVFDDVKLIKPSLRTELLAELSERTGLPIHKVDIISIDYLKDIANIKIYYYSKENENVESTYSDID